MVAKGSVYRRTEQLWWEMMYSYDENDVRLFYIDQCFHDQDVTDIVVDGQMCIKRST